MNKNILAIIVALVIVAGTGGVIILSKQNDNKSIDPVRENNNSSTTSIIPESKNDIVSDKEITKPSPFTRSGDGEKTPVITYSVFGFSPGSLEVTRGTAVTFKNSSSQLMWPASGQHPTHNEYPASGGCVGSAFDSCKEIPKDESWTFTFDQIGTWKYHDHLNPSRSGTIIVK